MINPADKRDQNQQENPAFWLVQSSMKFWGMPHSHTSQPLSGLTYRAGHHPCPHPDWLGNFCGTLARRLVAGLVKASKTMTSFLSPNLGKSLYLSSLQFLCLTWGILKKKKKKFLSELRWELNHGQKSAEPKAEAERVRWIFPSSLSLVQIGSHWGVVLAWVRGKALRLSSSDLHWRKFVLELLFCIPSTCYFFTASTDCCGESISEWEGYVWVSEPVTAW